MLDQFNDNARRTVVRAQEEARRLDHSYIGTEHLLIGFLSHRDDAAAAAPAALDLTIDAVREQVEQIVGRGSEKPGTHLVFTESAKLAIEDAIAEAFRRTQQVGPQHLLLGILERHECTAVRVLTALGADLEQARRQVIESLA